MATSDYDMSKRYEWAKAKSLMPAQAKCERGLQGALVPDSSEDMDHIAVVYDKGETPSPDNHQTGVGVGTYSSCRWGCCGSRGAQFW